MIIYNSAAGGSFCYTDVSFHGTTKLTAPFSSDLHLPIGGKSRLLFWNLWSTSGSLAAWNAWTNVTVPSRWSLLRASRPLCCCFFSDHVIWKNLRQKSWVPPGTLSKSVYCSYDLSWSSSNQGRYLQQNLAPLLNDSHRMDLAISTKKRKEPQPVNLSAPANKCQCGHVSILATPRVESAATQNAKMLEDHSKRSPWQLKK